MSTAGYEFTVFDRYAPYSTAGPYTAADYWRLPEGEPVELIQGRLVMSPAPISLHQFVVRQLSRWLESAEESAGGVVYISPIDVVLDDQNIVQPDLIYLAKDRLDQIGDRIEGAPSLVIEVLSPSTANRDRQQKLQLYARHSVPEYWMVDPDARTLEFLVNDEGRFVVATPTDGVYTSAVTPELVVDPAEFWAEADRRLPRGKA
ncbi:MAG: Uma2 family endonuclease [Planctomycetota bacterium]